MNDVPKIGVVIPAYKVAATIKQTLDGLPGRIDTIIVVDDKCPESSGKEAERLRKENVHVLYHIRNEGVGGAVITGYTKALELGCDVVVKMDGDLQMDPGYMDSLIQPVVSKYSRLCERQSLQGFPCTESDAEGEEIRQQCVVLSRQSRFRILGYHGSDKRLYRNPPARPGGTGPGKTLPEIFF